MEVKWRLFWAVALPAALRRQLSELQRQLGFSSRQVKWVEEGNLHLTVRFLGDTPHKQVEAIKEAVALHLSGVPAFVSEVDRLGAFPSLRRPRVLWVGVKAHPLLSRLHGAVEAAVRQLGFAPEERPFAPHITLGRVREREELGADRLAQVSFPPAPLPVDELVLFRSVLSAEGPLYQPLAALRLLES
ncbi:RNA 2',3'-cyclic phosphodiesterase [Desulfothermobacter acidiphilus]|uniref:RNA 2',3'-cyclic phosphodiesterase n=1 Tax=Desulfothermobacter acidiphilus TaxID=1938353 RepID=UPI003F8C0E01